MLPPDDLHDVLRVLDLVIAGTEGYSASDVPDTVHARQEAIRLRDRLGFPLSYQERVGRWMAQCFSRLLYADPTQRCDRFLEEALELLQAEGYDRARVATLVDYVWSRPVGDPRQEVGGTMVTLAALCFVAGIDMRGEAMRELERIEQPEVMEKIRRKQEAKNALRFDSPLPGAPDVAAHS